VKPVTSVGETTPSFAQEEARRTPRTGGRPGPGGTAAHPTARGRQGKGQRRRGRDRGQARTRWLAK